MGEPDPWGSIINPLRAAHLIDMEEAWNHAAESNAVPISGEPQLYFTRSTQASISSVPLGLWILRSGNTHLTARGENF